MFLGMNINTFLLWILYFGVGVDNKIKYSRKVNYVMYWKVVCVKKEKNRREEGVSFGIK